MRGKIAAITAVSAIAVSGLAAAPASAGHNDVHSCEQAVADAFKSVFRGDWRQDIVNLAAQRGIDISVSDVNAGVKAFCENRFG